MFGAARIDSAEVPPFTQVYIEVRDTNLLAVQGTYNGFFPFRFKLRHASK